jgi:hypothetical protein
MHALKAMKLLFLLGIDNDNIDQLTFSEVLNAHTQCGGAISCAWH